MKTQRMNMDALRDAKELVYNLQNAILQIKQELEICGAFMPDSVQENLTIKLVELTEQYTNAVMLVQHYEKELGY